MDLATVVGAVGGLAVVMWAILMGGSFMLFVDIPSMAIVLGGTTFVVAMKFTIKDLPNAIKVALKAFLYKPESVEDLIEKAMELAEAARKGGGPLGMQNVAVENPFFKKAVDMVVDGFDPEVVENILAKEKIQTFARHDDGIKIFKAVGDVAPAMGMIGTLIGLVQMLANMSDPSAIGPAMAVAIITTFYGAVISNMIAFPIAHKLELRSAEEKTNQSLIIDAVLGIQKGLHPRIIRDALQNYVKRSDRATEDDAGGGASDAKAA